MALGRHAPVGPGADEDSHAEETLCQGMRDLMVAAAYAGHLGVLSWLKTRGTHVKRACTLAAAYNGHTHVLRWARTRGVRFSGLVTSAAAARGHRECALFCERECNVPLLWEYDEPVWRRSRYTPLGHFEFGRRRHVAEMASSYGCAASARWLARRCPVVPTERVLRDVWLAGDLSVILPLTSRARTGFLWRDLMMAAAAKCQIAVLGRLFVDPRTINRWDVQEIFLAATRSRYGWRNLFTWMADHGHRCCDTTMYNMISRYSGPYAREAFAWAVDRWCPWPRGDRYMMYRMSEGSRAAEWVLMSDEDPLVIKGAAVSLAHVSS